VKLSSKPWLASFFWLCAAFLLAGCGGKSSVKGLKVEGKLLLNGQPLKFQPNEEITVSFAPADAGGKAVGGSGAVKPEDGTFTLATTAGPGIPAGKYQIRVSSQIYGGDGKDRFADFFEEVGPLAAEVAEKDGQTFIIDLGKKTVTKQ
jgi:hypothetical protein